LELIVRFLSAGLAAWMISYRSFYWLIAKIEGNRRYTSKEEWRRSAGLYAALVTFATLIGVLRLSA